MADITVTVEKIGVEDINFGTGGGTTNATFSRTTSTGGSQTIHKVTAKAIPIEDDNSYWTGGNLEDWLDGLHEGNENLVANDTFIRATDHSGTSHVDIVKVNSDDKIELGTLVSPRAYGFVPVGTIVPWIGGYFGDGSNGSYTHVLGSSNTVAAINSYLNDYGWYVCNGAALNDSDSPIFGGSGRYLPNLTDDRFIMGDTTCGGTGGDNSMAHTHGTEDTAQTNLYIDEVVKHRHTAVPPATAGPAGGQGAYGTIEGTSYTNYTGYAGTSTTVNVKGVTDGASTTENRPAYLSCYYIIRVK